MAVLDTAYFVTVEYIKKYYSIYLDQNIDDDSLSGFILISQDKWSQSSLGENLYKKYINDINNNGGPTGPYEYLFVNFIQKALSLWTIYESLPALTYKMTNKSLSQKSSEYGKPSDQKAIELISTRIVTMAQFYDARVRQYCLNNPGDIPEYFVQPRVDSIAAKNQPYDAGLYLPDVAPFYGANKSGWQQDDRCCTGRGTYLNW